jgi:hypothetical protein
MKLREVAELSQQERSQFKINHKNVEAWLVRMGVQNFTIDPHTNVVDVNGDVNCRSGATGGGVGPLSIIPIQFGIVTGGFDCSGQALTSLAGCPHTVGYSFSCSANRALTSLHGAPSTIGGNLYCHATKIISLHGIEKIVKKAGGKLSCNAEVTHILGLLLVDGFTEFDIKPEVNRIMNKYIGTGDIIAAQDELIDAGFIEQARL